MLTMLTFSSAHAHTRLTVSLSFADVTHGMTKVPFEVTSQSDFRFFYDTFAQCFWADYQHMTATMTKGVNWLITKTFDSFSE